jgi:hypothetical protein
LSDRLIYASQVLPGAASASSAITIEPLVLMLTGTAPEPPAAPPDLTGLALSVARARKDYQACRYAELVTRLPRLLSQLDTACRSLTGGDRLRACALSADAYHVAAGFLLKTGDPGLAHIATDRSMTAALASQDPLTVGASARIVTHTLMSSGHLTAAVTTAQNHAARLDRETGITTPGVAVRLRFGAAARCPRGRPARRPRRRARDARRSSRHGPPPRL